MTTKANCPDAFVEDEPDNATFCDRCSYTSTPDEFIHVGNEDLCRECVIRALLDSPRMDWLADMACRRAS